MIRRFAVVLSLLNLLVAPALCAQQGDSTLFAETLRQLLNAGLADHNAHSLLAELVTKAPNRLSGTEGYRQATVVAREMMRRHGVEKIRLLPVKVPIWLRGQREEAMLLKTTGSPSVLFEICALGGSIGTPENGVEGEVLEVRSFDELRSLGSAARGKIVFFNRPMGPLELNTRDAYVGAVNQRVQGAIEASNAGAIAVVVRSMTLALDNVPHAGGVSYEDNVVRIPAAAISTEGANKLSALVKADQTRRLRLTMNCRHAEEVESANVIGEIRGRERPNEIVLIGAHLDSWDKGIGAHDDGAGCAQVIEALNLIIKTGIRPKRTIRLVLFENEERGARGALAYRDSVLKLKENHVVAIESDHGGFAPRGFTYDGGSALVEHILQWKPLFETINAGRFVKGHPGVDIAPLVPIGIPGFGLDPENHRYFDYHHSEHDTLDKVHPRELELGAIAIAFLAFLFSEV